MWVEREKDNAVLKKINELSKKVSFDSEFNLPFEIQQFNFFFFFTYIYSNFSNCSHAEWIKSKHCFRPKV